MPLCTPRLPTSPSGCGLRQACHPCMRCWRWRATRTSNTLPDVIIFTNIVNDVVFFYKEYSAGERGNYLDMRAEKDGIEVIRAQRILADEGITVYKRIMATLADEPEYRANFEAYARGSTHFHTSSPRYRLRELFPKPG
ncbi:hypothetical protein F5Y16DRAFT_392769 [Xylariaceae sp. FL0255]|nr:hypothetical protein F5Y16DRAFT_392769 [Xylariaceae sp. FL0255]